MNSALRERLIRERLEGTAAPAAPAAPDPAQADRTAAPPLSWGQRQFWAMHAAAPESPEYLVPLMFRLRGAGGAALDEAAMAQAWNALADRHEILRTTYPWDRGGPRPVVGPLGTVDFAVLDLTAGTGVAATGTAGAGTAATETATETAPEGGIGIGTDAAWEARTGEVFERETAIPIDLTRQAPLRVRLIRHALDDHVLLAVFHHIACDAATHGIVARELAELYRAAVEGRADRLPPVPIQYADYALWEQSRDLDLDYWRDHLAGLAPLELPTDRPHPADRDWTGATVPVAIPEETARRIRALAARHGATPYVVLLTAFQALLARYTGRSDIAVGTAVSARTSSELQNLVGYVFNTLTLRARWSGGSFADLLAANRGTVLDAFDHADAPFAAVADAVRPGGDRRLFQVMLDLRAGSAPDLDLPGLTTELLPTGKGVARFDLTLHLRDDQGPFSGELEYATALFDESTAHRIAGHYVRFLDRATADPDAPVALVDFLSDAERGALLARPEPAPDFRFRLADAPHAVALSDGNTETTFAELEARANQYAHHLCALGLGPGSMVGVRMRRTPDLVACLLGVWKTGAAYVPVDVSYPADRVQYILENSGAAFVIEEETDVDAQPTTTLAHTPDPDSLAYVMYTSGSTGRPKGVAVTHRGLANYLAWAVRRYVEPHSRPGGPGGAPFLSSIAFDLGVPNLFAPLAAGQTVRLIPDGFDAADLGALLAAGAPYAFVKITPGHLDLLATQLTPEQARSFAGLVIAAGDEFPQRLVTRWSELGGPPLAAEYGPTEITVGNSAQFDVGGTATELVPIGSPIPGTTMYVLDENMLPAPTGVVGEVYIGGVGLARGYVNRPGLTAEKFLPDPYGEPGTRLYRTGDLARVLADGSVDFAGRVDHQVKLRGYRIELGEIEAVLTAEAGVRDAVVVLREDRLVAYFVGAADPDALRRRAADALPAYMVPSAFVALPAIPLTANGKVDRRALPAPERDELVGTGYVAPSGPVQELVAAIFARVLKVDRPGAADSFFDLGGDSISAVGLAGALREAGLALSVRDVFAARTIAALAALAEAAGPDGGTRPAAAPAAVVPFALLDPADRAALPPGLADAYPVSLTQRGMLLEMMTGGEVNYYHNITTFRIKDEAPFDLAAFQAAADLVVARHEVMRTTYDLTSYSVPLQLVRSHASMPVGRTDLRHLDPDRFQEALLAHSTAERAVLFELDDPPLMRMHVHLGEPGAWWLSITESHPVLEGWSYHSQLMEMLLAYRRIRDGLPPREPEPVGGRYADFIAAELAALESAEDQAHWRTVLTENTKFTVPAAWADPAGGTERYQLTIPIQDLEEPLRALASAADTPYKSVLHAAHLYVLSTLTPDEAFHSGVVCDGRPELPGLDRVSGMYLNSVPFPHRRGARSWLDLVRQTFDSEIAMWPHRHYPMPAMPRLAAGVGRPVDVLFHYLDFHQVDTALVDAEARIDDSPNEFRLVVGTPIKGFLSIAGTPAVLAEGTAAELAGRYRAVLEAMVADPAGDPRGLALPGSPRLVGETRLDGGSGGVGVLDGLLDGLLDDLLSAGEPGAVAVVAGARRHTFAELRERVDRVASALRARGVGAEDTVGVLVDRGFDLVAALLGVLRAGAAYVPLDPGHPDAALHEALPGTALVLTSAEHAGRVAEFAPVLVGELPGAGADAGAGSGADPDSLAYVIRTSGSTGRPNAVGITRRGLANYLAWAAETYADGGEGAYGAGGAVLSSIAFDITVPNLFVPLLTGQAVHMLLQDLDPADLGAELLRHAPYSFLMLTASHLGLLAEQLGDAAVTALAGTLVSAGEALPSALAARLPGLRVEYGPTEATVGVTGRRVEPADRSAYALLGTPIPDTVVQLLDADLAPVPVGIVGEIHLAGVGLARGYVGAPGLTAERFVPDPYGPPGSRLYRTGDLARMDQDGRLEFVGRADDQLKVRGHRVEPAEVRAALEADPRVAAAAVVLRDAVLVAYVVADAAVQGAVDVEDVRAGLAARLPAYMVPARLVLLPALPLTDRGKLDRAALPDPDDVVGGFGASGSPRGGRAPESSAERALAEIWARLLDRPVSGVGDTLIALGGDSLLTLQVLAAARRDGLDLPRDLLRSGATLETIAANAREIS